MGERLLLALTQAGHHAAEGQRLIEGAFWQPKPFSTPHTQAIRRSPSYTHGSCTAATDRGSLTRAYIEEFVVATNH